MEDPLVTFETTSKGKPMGRDSNYYTYVANASFTEVKYWKCSVKMCSELKTFEWDILNPDRIINLEIKNERKTSNI